MASVWTTLHCGAVVKDKYIPHQPPFSSSSSSFFRRVRNILTGRGSGIVGNGNPPPPENRWIRQPAVPIIASPFLFSIHFGREKRHLKWGAGTRLVKLFC